MNCRNIEIYWLQNWSHAVFASLLLRAYTVHKCIFVIWHAMSEHFRINTKNWKSQNEFYGFGGKKWKMNFKRITSLLSFHCVNVEILRNCPKRQIKSGNKMKSNLVLNLKSIQSVNRVHRHSKMIWTSPGNNFHDFTWSGTAIEFSFFREKWIVQLM